MKVVKAHSSAFKLLEEKSPPNILWTIWLVHLGCSVNVRLILRQSKMRSRAFWREGARPSGSLSMMGQSICMMTRTLSDVEGTLDKGMGAFIEDLKEEFRTVEDAYVWHAFLGYWGGVRPKAPAMPESKVIVPRLSQGLQKTMDDLAANKILTYGIGFVPPELAYKLYNGLHSHLVSAGIDGVKIDVIHVIAGDGIGEYGGRVEVAKAYYKALSASIRNHFNGNGVIASMEQGNDFMLLGTEAISLGRVGMSLRIENRESIIRNKRRKALHSHHLIAVNIVGDDFWAPTMRRSKRIILAARMPYCALCL
ncbi:hypothetical protein GH714_022998 [Hevea brasiliensis]|uniref:Uncharacterized protein n=1 Tax=Hevea brasiliensis TaxID=3981 RepID=A0A6A6MG69_HEVBR|nr:hypothetical protein GH714_022998 [Hevea brasiliensis]